MVVYGFNSLTPLIGFMALEQALKDRAKELAPHLWEKKRFPGFFDLLKHAIKIGWISEERISNRDGIARARVAQRKFFEAGEEMKRSGEIERAVDEPSEQEIIEEMKSMRVLDQMVDSAVSLRNSLAHGELFLIPNSWTLLSGAADLINQLYDYQV
ncbi:MAG: hypothetical protein ACREHG_03510 [Candidatus Saccharimonadales bacterium]